MSAPSPPLCSPLPEGSRSAGPPQERVKRQLVGPRTGDGQNKKKRTSSDRPRWKPLQIDGSYLAGCEESGFAGLEVLENAPLIEDHVKLAKPGDKNLNRDGTMETKSSLSGEKVRRRHKSKKADNGSDWQQVTEELGSLTSMDAGSMSADDLKARFFELQEKARQLLSLSSSAPTAVRPDAAASEDVALNAAEPGSAANVEKKKKKRKIKGTSKIDGKRNEQDAPPSAETDDAAEMMDVSEWEPMNLHSRIVRAIAKLGFAAPMPIQEACLPSAIRDRRDIIGAAPTGSGKTLAFGLPIFQLLLEEQERRQEAEEGDASLSGKLRALILAPTRELALQVSDHLAVVGRACGMRAVAIVGGISQQKQQRLLRSSPAVVVATPGRLWALMREGQPHVSDLTALSFLVLDEADRMVQQGSFQELAGILGSIPMAEAEAVTAAGELQGEEVRTEVVVRHTKLQTFVFSATLTLPSSLKTAVRRERKRVAPGAAGATLESLMERVPFRAKPKIVDLTTERKVASSIMESMIAVGVEQRERMLYYLLMQHPGRCLVFVNAVSMTRRLASLLKALALPVSALHAQQQQRQRLKALDRFRANPNAVLLATDVAARGLDIPDVRCVVHYQLPNTADTYIHRCGRTARAQQEGVSVAFVAPAEAARFHALLKVLGREPPAEFPVDPLLLPECQKRCRLADRIDAVERRLRVHRASRTWAQRQAAELEVEVSDDEADGQRADVRQREAQAAGLRAELGERLARPLAHRIDRRFFTGGASTAAALQVGKAAQARSSRLGGGEDGAVEGAAADQQVVPAAAMAETIRLASAMKQGTTMAAAEASGAEGKATPPSGGRRKAKKKPERALSLAETRAAALSRAVATKKRQRAAKLGRGQARHRLTVLPVGVTARSADGTDALAALRKATGGK